MPYCYEVFATLASGKMNNSYSCMTPEDSSASFFLLLFSQPCVFLTLLH